jgi:hypothetical protein
MKMVESKFARVAWGMLAMGALAACEGTAQVAAGDPQTQTQTQAQSGATAGADGADGADRAASANRHPPHAGSHRGPPAEAFDACSGKAVSDPCSVTFHDETLAGKCVAPPEGATETWIACRPDKPPPPPRSGTRDGHPHGPPPAEVFTACDGKAAGAACSVKLGDRTIDGTCKTPPAETSETRLGCLPSHPR